MILPEQIKTMFGHIHDKVNSLEAVLSSVSDYRKVVKVTLADTDLA